MSLLLTSSRRLCAALGLFAALTTTLRADAPPALAVAGQQRVELRSLARPSALLSGMAHIGASSSVSDGPRVTYLDPGPPPLEFGPPGELDASRVLPLLGDNARGTLQRVLGHDATLTLIGDDLYIQRRGPEPDEHVLSVRALWEQLGEITCGLAATQIHYDIARRQWSLAAVANPGRADATLLLATSETSDPLQGWELQRLHLSDNSSFGTLPPTVLRAGAGLLVRAGTLAETGDGACTVESSPTLGVPTAWLLTGKDGDTRENNPLTNPTVSVYGPTLDQNRFGRGSSAILTLAISDPVSASDLRQGWLLINSVLDGRNACWVAYDVATSRLSLVNDAGTGLVGSLTPSQAGTVENSQCAISASGSLITVGGSDMTRTIEIPISIRFKSAFAGTKLIYAYADDQGGLTSTWQLRGYWTVPEANVAPILPYISPTQGSGTSQAFTVSFSDPDGPQDFRQVWLLVGSSLDARNACWVFYDVGRRQFGLVNDAGTAEAGRVAGNQAAAVANSQCSLQGSDSRTFTENLTSDRRFYVTFSLSFKQAFAGLRRTYGYADDTGGQTVGWRHLGQWIVPVIDPQPRVLAASPTSGRGPSTYVSVEVSDPAGYPNVREVSMLISSTLSSANACWIVYDSLANRVALVNNAGTAPIGYVKEGENAVVENDQCEISGMGYFSKGLNSVTFSVPVRFKAAFDGAKTIYAYVDNKAGQASGWQVMGTWSVLNANLPPLVSANGTPGSGSYAALFAGFTDPNGYADVRHVWVLVNTTLDGAGACWVFYDIASGQIGLVNDAGTGEAGRITLGTSASVQNSQCTLSGAGSTLAGFNPTVGVTFSITFKPSFIGLKSVFVNAIDQGGLASGWQPLLSWNVR